MSLSFWVQLGLLLLVLNGCGAKHDPYGQQVQRATTYSLQGEQWFSQGDLKKASRDFSRALEVSRAVDYPTGVAQQLNNLGAVALEQGDLKKARELFGQAWEINQNQNNWAEGSVNQANLATVAQKEGKAQEAEQHLQAAQEAAQKANSKAALGRVLLRWASSSLDRQDYAAAGNFLQQARGLATTPDLKGALFHHWGRLSLAQGDTAAALNYFSQALKADREILDRAAMAADLFALGETQQLRGDLPQAWDYYSRAFDMYASLGKKAQLPRCLQRLQEVNTQGQMGHTLARFEKHPLLSPAGEK